jgi:drug/metabolite transporter (DMT)-like permease
MKPLHCFGITCKTAYITKSGGALRHTFNYLSTTMDTIGEAMLTGHSVYARAGGASTGAENKPSSYKVIGLVLAIASGLFIGVSFVLKKHGLLKANEKYNEEAGEGYGYLKNVWWWAGMTLMIIGEICNFAAYLFADAILVTPLGALAVVVTAILSSIFLKERLSFVGKMGCFSCIVGSVVIAANAPEQRAVTNIQDMQKLVIAPGFLSFAGVILVGCTFVALWAGPRYGKKTMLVYLTICSLIGGLSVSCIQGIGAAITAQARGEAQFNKWFTYFLIIFVIATLVTEVIFLNVRCSISQMCALLITSQKALNLYNAALVTPTYYVYFTSATIVTSAVLYRGFKGTPIQILTVVLGFLEICSGVVLLQLSKSAKDVPDTAIFKGDLDQMRTVAEQEEPEYEPRADAIRGGSAIIRSISKARQHKQMEEARRLREEHEAMLPIAENEQVEFDGIRRRRTTIRSNRAPSIPGVTDVPDLPNTPVRRKSIHPPLGMSKFPDPEEQDDADMHPGFFSNLMKRNKSSKTLPPTPDGESVPMSPVKSGDAAYDNGLVHPRPQYPSSGLASQSETDTSYKSLSTHVQWASAPSLDRPGSRPGASLEPPAPPPHGRPDTPGGAKRQFSFQNVLHPRRRTSSGADDNRPISRGGLSFISRGASKGGTKAGTEEERAGLVKGDSSTRLSGDGLRSESPPHYSDPDDDWQVTRGPSPPMRTVEGSFMDVEQTRLPRYTSSPGPAETIRPVRRETNESPNGGSRRGTGSGSGSQDEKGGKTGSGSFL